MNEDQSTGEENSDTEGVTTLAAQGSITFVGNVAGKLLNFGFLVVVTNLIAASTFGIFSLGLSVIFFSKSVTDLSIQRSLDYFIPQFIQSKSYGKAKYVLFSTIGIGLLGTGIAAGSLVLAAPFLSGVFNEPELKTVLPILALVIPLLTLRDIANRFFVALKDLKYRVLLKDIVRPSLKLLLTGGLALLGSEMIALLTGFAFTQVIVAILAAFLIKRRISDWSRGTIERVPTRKLLSYSLPLMFAGVIYTTVGQIDYFILGFVETTTAEEIGIYRVVILFGSNLIIFLNSLSPVFKPMITEVKDDTALLDSRFTLAARWILLLTLPVALTLILIPEVYLSLFFTQEYAAGAEALSIIAVGYLIFAGFGPENFVLEGLGHTRLSFLNTVVLLVTNATLDIILIPRIGIAGAAIGTAVGLCLSALIGVVQINYLYGVLPFNKQSFQILLSGAPPLGVGWAAMSLLESRLLLAISVPLVVLATYFISLVLLDAFDDEDELVADLVSERLGIDLVGSIINRS